MSNRRIVCPPTVTLSSGRNKDKPYPFVEFMKLLLTDRRWGMNSERGYQAKAIRDKLEGLGVASDIDVAEPEYILLRQIAREPQFQSLPDGSWTAYDPAALQDVLSYIEAIEDAKKVPAHPVAAVD